MKLSHDGAKNKYMWNVIRHVDKYEFSSEHTIQVHKRALFKEHFYNDDVREMINAEITLLGL